MRIIVGLSLAGALAVAGCGDKEACTEEAYRCDGAVLEQCIDGEWEASEDCEAGGMVCHDMGDDSHCMKEGAM